MHQCEDCNKAVSARYYRVMADRDGTVFCPEHTESISPRDTLRNIPYTW